MQLGYSMTHWQETARIHDTLARLAEAGRSAALATVVRIRGSAYRRPGAKMLITDDGEMAGSVSGGCLEADVREHGLSLLLATPTPKLLHYDTGADDTTPFGLGLGCNGAVDIFVQPMRGPAARETTRAVRALLQGNESFAVATIVGAGDAAALGRVLVVGPNGRPAGTTGDDDLDRAIAAHARGVSVSQVADVAGVQVFAEVLTPPPTVLILGAGEDARPLAAYATDAGFRVVVADHRPAYLDAAHYLPSTRLVHARSTDETVDLPLGPRTLAVVKTHSLAHDRGWVQRLLATDVPYIGVLGPRTRVDDVLKQLGAEGNDRVFGPVGLDLGAEGPEQIAMSITAELLAVWSSRQAGHLREKDGVIHAR